MKWLQADGETRGGVGYWLAPFRKESGCRVNLTPTARWWERDDDEAGRVRSGAPLPADWVHIRVVVRHDKDLNRDVHEVWMRPAGAAREAKIIAAHTSASDAPAAGLSFFCEGGRLALREIKVRPEGRVGGVLGKPR
jgi:hypothetical protein